MDLKLHGKIALVTGSSSGIGESIARTLAREGAAVVVHGRSAERTNRVAGEIKEQGGTAFAVVGDLTDEPGPNNVVRKALQAAGHIDILVNNAGGSSKSQIHWENGSVSDWKDKFELNLFAPVRVLHAVLPHMKNLGWGRIVQISTGLASQPGAMLVDYAAAKAALNNMTVTLARQFAKFGITINTVSPGPVRTPSWERLALRLAQEHGWGDDWKVIEKNFVTQVLPNPVGRVGRVEDVAHAVAFLASPLAGFINGANLRIDGGWVNAVH